MKIHPTSVIHPTARIHPTSVISPFAVIGPNVVIGESCFVGPYASIGMKPDMRIDELPGAWWEEKAPNWEFSVTIGNHSVIKEHVSVHCGTHRSTFLGSNSYIMPKVHIGHDVVLIGDCTISPNAQIAGHVVIGRGATLGMSVLVHQRIKIGCGSMIGMGTQVRRNVDFFSKVLGTPQRTVGLNTDFLKRMPLDVDEITILKRFLTSESGEFQDLNIGLQKLITEDREAS
jgi:UDP-N-acetylglucosamine acyltransferase